MDDSFFSKEMFLPYQESQSGKSTSFLGGFLAMLMTWCVYSNSEHQTFMACELKDRKREVL